MGSLILDFVHCVSTTVIPVIAGQRREAAVDIKRRLFPYRSDVGGNST